MKKVIALIVKTGPLKGHQYYVKTDCPVLVGRAEEANIRLTEDQFCSRSQAVVYWDKESCYVKDLESTNGTYVNKEKITGNIELKNNDLITFGSTDVVVLFRAIPKSDKPLLDVV